MITLPADDPVSPKRTPRWWRDAVIYQVYVRSFLDSTGDGIGDLAGVRAGLPHLKKLGVDGISLSPFYPSPQHDHGYDVADYYNVDPIFGDLAEFDLLMGAALRLDVRVLLDIVPNHCSSKHPWFREALASPPGSAARARFQFTDGSGPNGDQPPNDCHAAFGGPAWTRVTEKDGRLGQWYHHVFTSEQPDWNWRNPEVPAEFDRVLRFWLDRGVDGFRIDTGAGRAKRPDLSGPPKVQSEVHTRDSGDPPTWSQMEVRDVLRRWRTVCKEYTVSDSRERLLVGEVSVPAAREGTRDVRIEELHHALSFDLLSAPWNADTFRDVISAVIQDMAGTGSTATWILNNHDQVRTVTRYGEHPTQNSGLGAARARAAALLMLALPGATYIYQGEELGLPEVVDLPDDVLTDPIFHRTGSRSHVRDGCRVPLPWSGRTPPFGFSSDAENARPWLPQPEWFSEYVTDQALIDTGSLWHLYHNGLHLRSSLNQLGEGTLRWLDTPQDVLGFVRGDSLVCAVNFGTLPTPALVSGTPLLASGQCPAGVLPGSTAAWWISDSAMTPAPPVGGS
ncbi:glycoside hydrolase family 13 protein [Streptomyces mirabilis]